MARHITRTCRREPRGPVGWRGIMPNPLLPFIAFRVAVPGDHPALRVEDVPAP